MIVLSFAKYTKTEQVAALASGMAVDWRRDDELPLRLIKNGPDAHRAEIAALGDRTYQALEYHFELRKPPETVVDWPPEDRDAPNVPIPPTVSQQQER